MQVFIFMLYVMSIYASVDVKNEKKKGKSSVHIKQNPYMPKMQGHLCCDLRGILQTIQLFKTKSVVRALDSFNIEGE